VVRVDHINIYFNAILSKICTLPELLDCFFSKVNYDCLFVFRNMPDIDTLMQEWPPEFEELLKEVVKAIYSLLM